MWSCRRKSGGQKDNTQYAYFPGYGAFQYLYLTNVSLIFNHPSAIHLTEACLYPLYQTIRSNELYSVVYDCLQPDLFGSDVESARALMYKYGLPPPESALAGDELGSDGSPQGDVTPPLVLQIWRRVDRKYVEQVPRNRTNFYRRKQYGANRAYLQRNPLVHVGTLDPTQMSNYLEPLRIPASTKDNDNIGLGKVSVLLICNKIGKLFSFIHSKV